MCSAWDIIENMNIVIKLFSPPQKRDDSWMGLYYTKSEEEELGAGVEGIVVMLILVYFGIPL